MSSLVGPEGLLCLGEQVPLLLLKPAGHRRTKHVRQGSTMEEWNMELHFRTVTEGFFSGLSYK